MKRRKPPSDAAVVQMHRLLVAHLLEHDLAFLVGGLFVVDRPAFYLPAVLASPLYPLLWAAGALRALFARRRWLSARRPA